MGMLGGPQQPKSRNASITQLKRAAHPTPTISRPASDTRRGERMSGRCRMGGRNNLRCLKPEARSTQVCCFANHHVA